MVVNGIPGQAEAGRELLTIGLPVPQIAENVKPGPVSQKLDGVIYLVRRAPTGGQHGLQRLPENAAVHLHRTAALPRRHRQIGVHTEQKGPDCVLKLRAVG